jgi:OOP family OmpA-OmpF porin
MKYCLFVLCLVSNVSAQNLVPNPGFEKFKGFPKSFMQDASSFNQCIKGWTVPNATTPDYIAPGFLAGNLFGSTHAGYCMVGLGIGSTWAECVYIKLETELEINTTYQLEFWIKRPTNDFQPQAGKDSGCLPGFVSSNFGMLLSDTLQTAINKGFIVGSPQLKCGEKFWLGKDWTKVSGYFTADKNYRYVYMGQFRPEGDRSNQVGSKYVLVDDLQIRKVTLSDLFVGESIKKPGAIIPLDQVYFETDKSQLQERSFALLDTLAALLSHHTIQIKINGHTDNQGDLVYNKNLSSERAKTIYDYLIFKGIDKKRLAWEGFGASRPVADNASEAGRQKNRRVEFEVMKE